MIQSNRNQEVRHVETTASAISPVPHGIVRVRRAHRPGRPRPCRRLSQHRETGVLRAYRHWRRLSAAGADLPVSGHHHAIADDGAAGVSARSAAAHQELAPPLPALWRVRRTGLFRAGQLVSPRIRAAPHGIPPASAAPCPLP